MKALEIYNRLSGLPAGKWLFSKAVSFTAPYFNSIDGQFVELKPGYCEITMKNRRGVRNHLGTVHAIAMCNMAELAGGTMTDASMPNGARWIPAGMSVKYVKKAKTDLRAIADGQNIDFGIDGDVVVPVIVKDRNDEIVFTADITMNLKQKQAA